MKEIKGIGVVEGFGLASALHYSPPTFQLDATLNLNADREAECKGFVHALGKVRQELTMLIIHMHEAGAQHQSEFLEVQLAMAEDDTFVEAVCQEIQRGHNLLYAANKVINMREQELLALEDPYFRERSADIRDLGTRLCCYIAGQAYVSLRDIRNPVIVLANDLPPSLLLTAPAEKIKGIVLEQGGKTSHVVIVAGGLGIPTIIGCPGVEFLQGMVFVDGFAGKAVSVLETEIEPYREIIRQYDQEKRQLNELRNAKSETLDGKPITLAANITGLKEAEKAKELGADGVGLFRTEFLYMDRRSLPTCSEQAGIYTDVVRLWGEQGTTIRTLDIGGDKKSACLDLGTESDFLGYRAIRICLDKPEMFFQQLKACLLASQAGNVAIMVPMVSSPYEILKTRQLVKQAAEELKMVDWRSKVRIGAMIEIPSAAICADKLAQCCDFFSIGTNDLTQYTLAADRNNAKVAMYYSWFSPAVLRLIKLTAQAAERANIMCGVCGEMAADHRATALLIGLGVTELSVPPAKILKIRETIIKTDARKATLLAEQALACTNYKEVEALLGIV